MKISKKDALMWFEFFASLPEDEELLIPQQELCMRFWPRLRTPSTPSAKK